MKPLIAKGYWRSAINPPENNTNILYIVTLSKKDKSQRVVAEEYWRYDNEWEMFFEGKWQPLKNSFWEVTAYIEIVELKPFLN